MTLEVRCCCNPRKLLGWLTVPDDVQAGQMIRFALDEPMPIAPRGRLLGTYDIKTIELPVAVLAEEWHVSRLALKSEETPIETLRKVRGFMEARA